MPVPKPLTKGYLCIVCKGTAADIVKTEERDRREPSAFGYVSCRTCNGNGLDPAEYFCWGNHPPPL